MEITPERNNGRAVWLCQCDCGNFHKTTGDLLRSGHTKSCGCLRNRKATIHGHATRKFGSTPTYKSWESAKFRVTNSNFKYWKDYGERGITMCDRWLNSFEAFLEDMGEKPDGLTLDRINTNGNYEPGNCRWATWKEQVANRRNTIGGKYK
jgi:hypothetical protein